MTAPQAIRTTTAAPVMENATEFAELLAGYTAEYAPETCTETELVRQLTVATLRLRRLDSIETDDEKELDRNERLRMRAERSFTRCCKELEARKRSRPISRTPPDDIEIKRDTRREPVSIQRIANQSQPAATASSKENVSPDFKQRN